MTSAVSPAVPHTALPLAEYVNTEQVLAAIPSILIGIDMATRITWWNSTAEQTFGLAPSQVVGLPLQGLATCRSTRARVSVDDVRFRHLNETHPVRLAPICHYVFEQTAHPMPKSRVTSGKKRLAAPSWPSIFSFNVHSHAAGRA
jgi:PAS domain-containing protein